MANVLLGITGSVAAIRAPQLYRGLLARGHNVRVVATAASEYFFDAKEIVSADFFRDKDEWPGQSFQRGDAVLHIELRRWADVLLIAPLDANTLAKLANGLCDNCLTCVWRAWDLSRPTVIAPAMNTIMWAHPATQRHLKQIRDDVARFTMVGPITKELVCGDIGDGAMAEIEEIIAATEQALSLPQKSR